MKGVCHGLFEDMPIFCVC